MVRSLLLAGVLLSLPAWAHDADIIYAQLERGADGVVSERLTLTETTLLLLAPPVDADGDSFVSSAELTAGAAAIQAGIWEQIPLRAGETACTAVSSSARQKETYLQLDAQLRCPPGELTQTFRVLSVLPSNYKVVLGAYGDGELKGQAFAQGTHQTLTVLGTPEQMASNAPGLFGWIVLGVEHIFLGIDHLAFLLAVLLVGGSWKRVLLLVTSFTIAHSITLGVTALGIINLSAQWGRWVEIAIAASIIWMALENLLLRTHRHRALLTFAFGLIHGFGFAQVLAELGLGEQVVTGLLGFNLGVELGQAAVVAVAFPLLQLMARRQSVNLWAVRAGSVVILAAGAFWMVERVVG